MNLQNTLHTIHYVVYSSVSDSFRIVKDALGPVQLYKPLASFNTLESADLYLQEITKDEKTKSLVKDALNLKSLQEEKDQNKKDTQTSPKTDSDCMCLSCQLEKGTILIGSAIPFKLT